MTITEQGRCLCVLGCFQVGREVLDLAARAIKPGVTTDEIDWIVHEATVAAGTNHLTRHVLHLTLSLCRSVILLS